MITSFHFSFTISHLTFISHFPFINCSMLTDKLLGIENCKMLIASEGGL